MHPATPPVVVLAGATGELGSRIAARLRERGAGVRAIVRPGGDPARIGGLAQLGVSIVEVDFADPAAMARACDGASCVVSALAGLREVIVVAQSQLLLGAVKARVPRFIPSDFCIDYARLTPGTNRNLDLRREFRAIVDTAPLRATSILNGAFTSLLTGAAPIILFGRRRVLYWESADQPMDFTTIDDTAAFTAAAALDADTPRDLRIAGSSVSARDLAEMTGELTGTPFRLTRAGGLGRLRFVIRVTQKLFPARTELYPAWQGMQYLHDMFSGKAELTQLDNDRYPSISWTPVREVLQRHVSADESSSS